MNLPVELQDQIWFKNLRRHVPVTVQQRERSGSSKNDENLKIKLLQKESENKELQERNQFLQDIVQTLRHEVATMKNEVGDGKVRDRRLKSLREDGSTWAKSPPSSGNIPSQGFSSSSLQTCEFRNSPRKTPGHAEENSQPFAGLVYQWNVVQHQIDSGVFMAKRAKKFMAKLESIHNRCATDLVKASEEEMAKIAQMKPGDKMHSCRDAFLMILKQSNQMALVHKQFAERIDSVVMLPLSKFYEVGHSIAETTQENKQKYTKVLSQKFIALRKSEASAQHLIDDLLKQAEKLQKLKDKKRMSSEKLAKHHEKFERQQKKTLEAIRGHRSLISEVSKQQEQYLTVEMPSVLTQMQSIEEMRIEGFRKQILSYSHIIEKFSDEYLRTAEDIQHFGNAIKMEDDIKNFTNNCAQNRQLKLPEVRYALTKTSDELSGNLISMETNVFNSTLSSVMENQKKTHPELKVPNILVVLSKAIEDFGGFQTEGIFRVPASSKELDALKTTISQGDYNIPNNLSPHVPAGLMKDFLRTLRDALIPEEYYMKCISLVLKADKENSPVDKKTFREILSKLPKTNVAVLKFLTDFIHRVAAPENLEINKMTVANLAMVFAPSVLRNPSTDPLDMIKNIKHEVRFVDVLFHHLARI